MVNYDITRSENNTLMIIANTFDKNNLTTSILKPLPISIIKLDDSYDDFSSSTSSPTLEKTTANYKNYNTIKNSNPSSEINLIDIIKYLSLAIAIILGYIIYKRKKNKQLLKKK